PPDPFLVGLATLTLVSTAATTGRPLLILVDDAQWLDHESADAIAFIARRLYADRVCLLLSMREPTDSPDRFEGLPTLVLDPLSVAASAALVEAAAGGPVADHVRDRLLDDARGNPLALVEFAGELSPDQLAGSAQLAEPFAVDRRLERS